MSELLTLADRCEAATGPDRELDAAIFHAIGAPVPFQFANKLIVLEFNDAENAYFARVSDDMQVRYSPPAYTGSIDAAMTLVLETVNGRNTFPLIHKMTTSHWRTHIGIPGPVEQGQNGNASTTALALVAAALRARFNIQVSV